MQVPAIPKTAICAMLTFFEVGFPTDTHLKFGGGILYSHDYNVGVFKNGLG